MDAAAALAARRVLETRDVSPGALARRLRSDVVQSGRAMPSVATKDRGSAYILPWRGSEPLFTAGGTAKIPVDAEESREFLARIATGAQLTYGYPLLVDQTGRLSPLVFTTVVLRREASDQPSLAIAPGWRVRINHGPLARAGFDGAARERITDELEHGSFSGFRGFLDHLASMLGLEQRFVPESLPAPPQDPLPTGWYDLPVLMTIPEPTGQDSDIDQGVSRATPGPALLADLDRIATGSTQSLGRTAALEALTGSQSDERAPTVMPIEAMDVGASNSGALEAATTADLSVVRAADGQTADAFAIDLIASMVVDGQAVLYVAPDSDRLDALESRLGDLLGPAAGQIIRLGRPGLRPRMPEGAHAPTVQDDAPPLPTPTLSELAEKRRHASETVAAADRLRTVVHGLGDIHRRRIGIEALVDPGWRPLLADNHALSVGIDTVSGWQARLSGREPSTGRGLARLVKRKTPQPDPAAAVAAIVEALAPVPGDIVARLPLPDERADSGMLRHAFDQLALFLKWHGTIEAEAEQEAALEREASAAELARHATRARQAAVEMSRRILPERWGTVAGVDADGDRQLAEALATLIDRRVTDAGADDASRDRAIVRALGKAVGRFPLIMATPDEVARRLPLVPGLVLLSILDHSDSIPAAALPPLLERSRRACLISRSAASGGFSGAAGLAMEGRGATVLSLDDRMDRDVSIAAYLAQRAGGGWAPRPADGGEIVVDLPETVRGLRRHAPPELGRHGEIAAAIELLRGWKTLGLFDIVPRPTIGVISPLPDDADRLRRALKAVVPTTAAERSVVVGTPEVLSGRTVDLLVIMPGLLPTPTEDRGQSLAASSALYIDAVRSAKAGVHIIAARDPALAAGGHLAALVTAADARRKRYGSVRDMLAALAEQAGLPFEPTGDAPTAFGPFGTAYRIVLRDEAETAEQLLAAAETDATHGPPPLPVLIDRDAVVDHPETVLERLVRLA